MNCVRLNSPEHRKDNIGGLWLLFSIATFNDMFG